MENLVEKKSLSILQKVNNQSVKLNGNDKVYDITKRVSPQARAAIENTIKNHDYYKRSWFWNSGDNASKRRKNENRFVERNPPYQLIKGDEIISVSPTYDESCNHCYYNLYISVGKVKKDIRTLKAILRSNK